MRQTIISPQITPPVGPYSLDAAGIDFASVVKCNVFLVDMADFGAMNTVFAEVIPGPFPARSTVAVAALPLGARVEIECLAVR